jgi:hypothetical protein
MSVRLLRIEDLGLTVAADQRWVAELDMYEGLEARTVELRAASLDDMLKAIGEACAPPPVEEVVPVVPVASVAPVAAAPAVAPAVAPPSPAPSIPRPAPTGATGATGSSAGSTGPTGPTGATGATGA